MPRATRSVFNRAMNDVESAGLSLADPAFFADDETLQASLALLLSYPSGNRDEEVLEDPFRFDITRHPDPHLAFGFGAHYCLGAKMAFPSIGLPTQFAFQNYASFGR